MVQFATALNPTISLFELSLFYVQTYFIAAIFFLIAIPLTALNTAKEILKNLFPLGKEPDTFVKIGIEKKLFLMSILNIFMSQFGF